MRRRKLSRRRSRKMFRKTGSRTHRLNKLSRPGIGMRGGRRL